MTINEYWIYEITPILCLIAQFLIILKTCDYVIFKCLKND